MGQIENDNKVETETEYFVETEKIVVRDRPIKSILKAITWRIIASGTTFGLAMLFFGNDKNAVEKATYVAIIETAIKLILYYLHERAWAQLRWGRMLVKMRRSTPLSKNTFNFIFKVKRRNGKSS